MIHLYRVIAAAVVCSIPLASACNAGDVEESGDSGFNPSSGVQSELITGDLTQGAVYVQGDNAVGGNKVYAFARDSAGALTFVGAFPTGGNGSGLGWANEGVHAVLRDGDLLFVTNAGPSSLLDLHGSVSVFKITPSGLSLQEVKSSKGLQPLTVARRGNLVVVVNNDNTLTSYKLSATNKLTQVSHLALNPSLIHGGLTAHPSDIVFNKEGTKLVIAERQFPAALALPDQAWFVDVADINPVTGAVSNVVNNDVAALGGVGNLAAEPFGLAVGATGAIVVAHGRYEVPFGSYESTYTINANNTLNRTSFVASGGWDDCWSVIVDSNTPGQQWYYEQSFFDSAIRVAPLTDTLGAFTLVGVSSASGLQVQSGTDIAATPTSPTEQTYLYALNSTPALPDGQDKIRGFRVNRDNGQLTPIGFYGAGILPQLSVGIAAR